jgi:hypothetical protein
VLLGDSEVEQAWQLAVERGCPSRSGWPSRPPREDEHPLDAVTVYKRQVESLIDRKQAHWYEQAVAHVVHVGELYTRAGAEEDFAAYTHGLRRRHKPKTKFLAMLAATMQPT